MSVTVADIKKVISVAMPADKLDKIDPALPMIGQGVDSLAITTMAVALQKAYNFNLSVEDGLKLKTLNDVVAFINRIKG